jgi:rhodanese-related sulfurtransferase
MSSEWKKSFVEMTAIIAVAVVVGLVWNHRILMDVFSGKNPSPRSPSSASASPAGTLLPAGLLQVKELYNQKQAVFVDARDGAVFTKGHIKGAISVPVGDFDLSIPGFMAKYPPSSTLVIYCSGYGCHDSKTVGDKFLGKGYQQVLIFEGGFPEWKDAGLPTEGAAQ